MTFISPPSRRRTRHAASLLASALLAGAGTAHAQTTYSTNIINPFYTTVDTFSTTTTAASSNYNRAAVNLGTITDFSTTAASLSGQTAVAYAPSGAVPGSYYTPTTTGTYRVTNTTSGYGTNTDAGSSNFIQFLYSPTFTPGSGTTASLSLQNLVLADNPIYSAGSTTDSYSLTDVPAGTPLSFVNTGRYNNTTTNNASTATRSIGTVTTNIDLLNPGSTQNIADPDTEAEGTTGAYATGTSQTLTISDIGTVSSLNGITIVGLQHDYLGDLTATLTHNGITVDLFDHVGGTTQDASEQNLNDPGNGVIMSGDYTFSLTGASLSAFGYHPSGNGSGTWDTATPGTYAAAGNAAGGFDAANAGKTLSNFTGSALNGDWTLSLYDNAPANEGSFLGFKLNLSAAPEPSQWASLLIGGLGLGGLALRARRRTAKAAE